MKITSVRCYLCAAQNPSGYRAGSAIVRVETDAGLAGHGETLMGLFCAPAAKAMVEYYAPLLVGRDARDREGLWRLMFDSSVWWGRAGAAPSVLGAIDVALWDLAGQAAGKPCWALLAGDSAGRAGVPVYGSLGPAPADEAEMRRVLESLLSQGFSALKLGLQFGDQGGLELISPRGPELLSRMRQTLGSLRRALGDDFVIGVDGHMGGIPDPMGRDEALAVAKVLEEFNVNFFEEPLSYLDPDGYAWLRRRTGVRIAGGESLSLREGFERFTQAGGLSVLQPDVNFVGGFRAALAVADLAKEHGVALMPHSWCGGPGMMANLHLAIARGEVERLEWVREFTDLQRAAIVGLPRVRDGRLDAPAGPGLGIAFDEALAGRFPFMAGLAERASGMITA